jgi:hypothetical protein
MRYFISTRHLFIVFFIVSTLNIYAQENDFLEVTFSHNYGGSNDEQFFGGSGCADGGFVMGGLSLSDDHDLLQVNIDSANIFIVKCDSYGNKKWSRTYGGNRYDKTRYIMEDSDQNLVMVGGSTSTDGDINNNYGYGDLFVAKLNPAGDVIWFKNYGGSNWEGGRYVIETHNGNYVFCGYTGSTDHDISDGGRGLHDGWLTKIDRNGNVIWSHTYGGKSVDRIRSVVELDDGGFMFTGGTKSNSLDVSGNHGMDDLWAGRVDSLGNLLWNKVYGGSETDKAYHISKTSSNTFLLTGHSNSIDGDITNPHGALDGWIIEIDINGNLLWQNTIGGSNNDRFYRSFESSDGGIITAGSSASDDFDVEGMDCLSGDSYFILKHDMNRNFMWGDCFGGSKSDISNDLVLLSDSSFVLMGDSRSGDGAVSDNYGMYDYWIMKLDWIILEDTTPRPSDITATYNSYHESVQITSTTYQVVYLSIVGMDGKTILKNETLKLVPGLNEFPLPINNKTSIGVYTVSIYGTETGTTIKIPHIR